MTTPTRKATRRLLELAEDGAISWYTIAEMALAWMGEDEVEEMAIANGLLDFDEDEVEE